MELRGKYATAKVFTHNIEQQAMDHIQQFVDNEITDGAKVRIMPDVHEGKGAVIGTTIDINSMDYPKVCPNVVGVDIGCGIMAYKIENKNIDLNKLDKVVHNRVPAGHNVHGGYQWNTLFDYLIDNITFFDEMGSEKQDRIFRSLGTLGSGNHFVELDRDENGDYWLLVHSGSRNLGVQVATYHQKIAEKNIQRKDFDKVIDQLKQEGRYKEIQSTINKMKQNNPVINKELAYLEGNQLDDYLNDMYSTYLYAVQSRKNMLLEIVQSMDFKILDSFDSVHNIIGADKIIRKGATQAKKGQRLIIPLNMKDGSLICEGLGNADWNYSTPHGAGRVMSRTQARKKLNIDQYKNEMNDVYTTCVNEETIDEAPEVYKSAREIIDNIGNTAKVIHRLKPIYNFKGY